MHRNLVALLILSASVAAPAAAQATDQDTVCASIYALLAENARSTGLSSSAFESALSTAQNYHLAANPTDDPQRYQLTIIDSAQVLRDALAQGRLTPNAIVSTASTCNSRYAPSQ